MPDPAAAALRGSPDSAVLAALADQDPLALAEACARTLPAVAAIARRLLGPRDVEATVQAVYLSLWQRPPAGEHPLEGWLRARCFASGVDVLRARQAAPAVPSIRAVAPDLPQHEPAYLDAAERGLATLDETTRRVVLAAHDAGRASTAQGEPPETAMTLLRGLLALGAAPDTDTPVPDGVDTRLGDWVLGLLGSAEARAVSTWLGDAEHGPHAELVRALRRARRRLEGLPPAPDVGLRTVAAVLGGRTLPPPGTTDTASQHPGSQGAPPASALDAPDAGGDTGELRVAAVLEGEEATPSALGGSADAGTTSPDEAGPPPSPPPQASPEGVAADTGYATPHPPEVRDGDDKPAHRSVWGRFAGLLGGLLLIAIGVAIGLFVVGPLVVDWVATLLN